MMRDSPAGTAEVRSILRLSEGHKARTLGDPLGAEVTPVDRQQENRTLIL